MRIRTDCAGRFRSATPCAARCTATSSRRSGRSARPWARTGAADGSGSPATTTTRSTSAASGGRSTSTPGPCCSAAMMRRRRSCCPTRTRSGPRTARSTPDLLDNAPKFSGRYLPKLVWTARSTRTASRSRTRGCAGSWGVRFTGTATMGRQFTTACDLMYYAGYNACPIVYSLKKGETFTRWFNGDEARKELGLPGRIWWGRTSRAARGRSATGPITCGTCRSAARTLDAAGLLRGQPERQPATPAGPQDATHGNGLYDWQPNLAAGDWKDGAVADRRPGRSGKDSPALTADGAGERDLRVLQPVHHRGAADRRQRPGQGRGDRRGDPGRPTPVGEVPGGGLDQQRPDLPAGRARSRARAGSISPTRSRVATSTCCGCSWTRGSGLDRTGPADDRDHVPGGVSELKAGTTTVTYAGRRPGRLRGLARFYNKARLPRHRASFVSSENLTWSGYADDQKTALEEARPGGHRAVRGVQGDRPGGPDAGSGFRGRVRGLGGADAARVLGGPGRGGAARRAVAVARQDRRRGQ